jgi:predicted secreted protein
VTAGRAGGSSKGARERLFRLERRAGPDIFAGECASSALERNPEPVQVVLGCRQRRVLMGWVSLTAVFFIIWWLVLFVSLPIGLRTQDEEGEVVLGTASSAPGRPHMLRAIIRTTILAVIIFGIFYVLTRVLGYSIDDIPLMVPDFG